jgi:KipI family sensor histidine kinase inhibitor
MSAANVEPLGDGALLIGLGDIVDAGLNRAALALADALRDAGLPGIRDVAPAYSSVCVRYDVSAWTESSGGRSAYACIAERLQALLDAAARTADVAQGDPAPIEIPVCYDGEFAPDIDSVAAHAQLDRHEVVARHAGAEYRVAMLGFMPGFPYLLGLDPGLHAPRRASPRTRVPAGSVAIGGAQTGIYPRELPGGWQLIGRTPLTLFDPARVEPALLRPGQTVRFRAIGSDEFAALLSSTRLR